MTDTKDYQETFWEHLDDLRSVLIRIIIIAAVFSLAAFFFKEWLFSIIFAPKSSSFVSYKFLGGENFNISLMNTELTGQFMMHLKVSLVTGIIASSPYIIYELFRFVSPALYDNEKRYSSRIVLSAYIMFILGAVVNYFLIFPLTLRFLGTYEVSNEVKNMLTLDSYMDTLLMMTLVFGVVFEIPVVSWLLGRFGLMKSRWMRKYRRHAIVVILIMAAVITPTSDVFTLTIVFLPIWILYEISVLVVKRTEN
ncbi:MAG: twin-arginine translocase subunit TatC [Bacteroidales bacterium]|nr:twin-arginine translocase subunit TatC [Bacteroidales bacterium]